MIGLPSWLRWPLILRADGIETSARRACEGWHRGIDPHGRFGLRGRERMTPCFWNDAPLRSPRHCVAKYPVIQGATQRRGERREENSDPAQPATQNTKVFFLVP